MAREVDDIRLRAGAVFGECLGAGYFLGGLAGWTVVIIAALIAGDAGLGVILVYSLLAAGVGGMVGLVVGMGVGLVLLPIVRYGEPRYGARVVGRLVRVVALTLTMPLALLVGSIGDTAWMLGVVGVVSALTLVGAHVIAHRYLRRAATGTPSRG